MSIYSFMVKFSFWAEIWQTFALGSLSLHVLPGSPFLHRVKKSLVLALKTLHYSVLFSFPAHRLLLCLHRMSSILVVSIEIRYI